MIKLISFATSEYIGNQQNLTKSARTIGIKDIYEFNPKDISVEFLIHLIHVQFRI